MNDLDERNKNKNKEAENMVCGGCMISFMQNPIYGFVTLLSFFLALLFSVLFIAMKQRLTTSKKLLLCYGILFFLFFPAVFYFYTQTCSGSMLYSCNPIQSFFYTTLIAIGISGVIGFVATPFLYRFSSKYQNIREEKEEEQQKNTLLKRIQTFAKHLSMKTPALCLIDKAEPLAFSLSHIRPRIFISVGLLDLLWKKEVNAVLLHELGHIKHKASFLKFTNSLFRFLFPMTNFNIFHNELDEEEQQADQVAIAMQRTEHYLVSAKQKMREYYLLRQKMDELNEKHFKAEDVPAWKRQKQTKGG